MNNKFTTVLFLCFLNLTLVRAQNLLWTQLAHPDSLQVNGVSFSVDGSQILSGTNCHPAQIRLYNASNGTIDWDYEAPMALYCMMGVSFSSDGNYFASIEEMGNLLIFDYTQNPPDSLTTINMGTSYAFSVCFAPNSYKVAVGGSNGKLQTYNLQSGLIDIDTVAHSTYVRAVTYSPDNLMIATGGSDNKVKVWDTTGTLLHTLSSHSGSITSVKFTPDNSKVISSSLDNSIKIWNASTGALIHTIPVSSADVNAIEISPDGSLIASVSADKYIRIWNASSYVLESSFLQDHAGRPISVGWSTDGSKVVTGTSNGLVTLYGISLTDVTDDLYLSENTFIYPSPFHQYINIDGSFPAFSTIKIVDVLGRTVLSENLSDDDSHIINAINIILPGVYFAVIESPDKRILVTKLVKD